MADGSLTKNGLIYFSSKRDSFSALVAGSLYLTSSTVPITPYLVEGISSIYLSSSFRSPVFINPKFPNPIAWQKRLRKVDPKTVVIITTMSDTVRR